MPLHPLLQRRRVLAAALAIPFAARATAMEDAWPRQSIRIIVGFSSGSAPDISARILGGELSLRLKQPVIIDNRSGAAGNIGATAAARSPADGYALFYGTNTTNAINPSLYANLPYDHQRDFAPIGLIGKTYNILVVGSDSRLESYAKLTAAARAEPGKLSFASGGNGTSAHLTGELLNQRLGLRIVHVPYRTGDASMMDLTGGRIDMAFTPVATAIPYLQSGRLRAIAVTSEARLPSIPQTPTFGECGLDDFVVSAWGALFCPSGTPAPVIERIHRELQAVLANPAIAQRFEALGAKIEGGTPEALGRLVRSETLRWAEVVRVSGARID